MVETTDILISGGGVAGLTAAAAFGTAGFSVICVDPAPPVTDAGRCGRRPAHDRLPATLAAGAARGRALVPPRTPCRRAEDHADRRCRWRRAEPRIVKDFDAAEIADEPFGWNFPNWLLRREIVARLADLPNVQLPPRHRAPARS